MQASVVVTHMSARQWAQLIVLSFLWGCSFIFMELALADMPILTIVAGRTACAALALVMLMTVRGRSLRFAPKIWMFLAFASMTGVVLPFSLIVWGQTMITASLSSVLNGTMPFFSVLMAHFLLHDEPLKAHKLCGVAVGFSGVVIIMGADHFLHEEGTLLGQAAVLFAAVLYAWANIFRRRFPRMGIKPLEAATGEMIVAGFVLTPLALLWDQPWLLPMPGLPALMAVLGIGLLSTALAFIIYHRLLPQVGANNMSLVTFLIPVSAITMGVVFLGESLSFNQEAGIALIATGLVVIDGRLLRLLMRARKPG